jgi:hypothetical protein
MTGSRRVVDIHYPVTGTSGTRRRRHCGRTVNEERSRRRSQRLFTRL